MQRVPACEKNSSITNRPIGIRLKIQAMETILLTPERKAQLEAYAHRHGQDSVAALDDVLADYLAWEQQDYQEALEGIRDGYADFKAGRTQSSNEVMEELCEKHGLPR